MDRVDDNSQPLSDAELSELYRREAARLRQQADIAESIEMRAVLLEAADNFERMAAQRGAGKTT